MTVLLLIAVISTAAVTFFICFFTAACNENHSRGRCRIVRISPNPIQRTNDVSPFRAASTMLLHRASAVLR